MKSVSVGFAVCSGVLACVGIFIATPPLLREYYFESSEKQKEEKKQQQEKKEGSGGDPGDIDETVESTSANLPRRDFSLVSVAAGFVAAFTIFPAATLLVPALTCAVVPSLCFGTVAGMLVVRHAAKKHLQQHLLKIKP